MEKENVLEIEFQDVFDKVAMRIKYQNFGVLKRGEFYDEETGVESCWAPEYIKRDNKLYIQGKEKNKDSIIFLIDKEDLKKILEIVNKINEKYGTAKRWRAEKGGVYLYIKSTGEITVADENRSVEDIYRYELGNYFEFEKQAVKVKNSKEWQEFWAKVRAGEIGG